MSDEMKHQLGLDVKLTKLSWTSESDLHPVQIKIICVTDFPFDQVPKL